MKQLLTNHAVAPLLHEALRGMAQGGSLYQAYLGYMVLQAIALVLWWPKTELASALARGAGADVLVAVMVVTGATVAYTSLRAGAEELMVSGQYSLHEWRQVSHLRTAWLIVGYLGAHLITTAYLMLLSAPIVLTAWGVGGGNGLGLVLSSAGLLLVALCYRVGGALLYLRFGHAGALVFVMLRCVFAVGFVAVAGLIPATSYLNLVLECFSSGAPRLIQTAPFFLSYASFAVVLSGWLTWMVARMRSSLGCTAVRSR